MWNREKKVSLLTFLGNAAFLFGYLLLIIQNPTNIFYEDISSTKRSAFTSAKNEVENWCNLPANSVDREQILLCSGLADFFSDARRDVRFGAHRLPDLPFIYNFSKPTKESLKHVIKAYEDAQDQVESAISSRTSLISGLALVLMIIGVALQLSHFFFGSENDKAAVS
jgi:hypothetical protein